MEGGSGYDAFFKKAMKKFGISSPDLKTDEKKKEFFDYIDKNFTAKNEGYGGMAKMRRGGSEEEFRFPFGKNPYRPVSTPDDRPPLILAQLVVVTSMIQKLPAIRLVSLQDTMV